LRLFAVALVATAGNSGPATASGRPRDAENRLVESEQIAAAESISAADPTIGEMIAEAMGQAAQEPTRDTPLDQWSVANAGLRLRYATAVRSYRSSVSSSM
jgi:hypothetical protein